VLLLVGCGSNKRRRKCFSIVWLAFIWVLWKTRNDYVFSNVAVDVPAAVDRVQRLSWLWFMNNTAKDACLLYEWVWSPTVCKMYWLGLVLCGFLVLCGVWSPTVCKMYWLGLVLCGFLVLCGVGGAVCSFFPGAVLPQVDWLPPIFCFCLLCICIALAAIVVPFLTSLHFLCFVVFQ
jgi:hypothetical protein